MDSVTPMPLEQILRAIEAALRTGDQVRLFLRKEESLERALRVVVGRVLDVAEGRDGRARLRFALAAKAAGLMEVKLLVERIVRIEAVPARGVTQPTPAVPGSAPRAGGDAPAQAAAAPAGPAIDPRTSPRVELEVEVDLHSENNFYLGFSENISSGGLFIATHEIRPVGQRVTVRFRLPGVRDSLVAQCEVCWVRRYNPHSDGAPGMGLRFVDVDARTLSLVERFVCERDPIFFDEG